MGYHNMSGGLKILTVLALMASASPAQAQFARNSNAPINGSADNVDYRPEVTVLSGQVDVRQGEVRILSDKMFIYNGGKGTGGAAFDNVDRIEAIGNFFYLTPDQEVRGKKGVYEQATDTFTVTGDVILLQGPDNVVTGDKLIYNLTSDQATVVGTCRGRKCGREGRVNILIKNADTAENQ